MRLIEMCHIKECSQKYLHSGCRFTELFDDNETSGKLVENIFLHANCQHKSGKKTENETESETESRTNL